MKKTLILVFLSFVLAGCGDGNSAPQQQQQTTTVSQTTNTNLAVQRTNDSLVVSSHSTPGKSSAGMQANSAGSSTSSGSSSSPMAKAIDVSEETSEIEKADKEYKSKQNDVAKDALAKAYFIRAFALTEAAQYRAALGDFRKGLKLRPDDKKAKDMHDQIISIFQSINREPPKEGEEPPPMPFTKS